jgi:hypothetical protein
VIAWLGVLALPPVAAAIGLGSLAMLVIALRQRAPDPALVHGQRDAKAD